MCRAGRRDEPGIEGKWSPWTEYRCGIAMESSQNGSVQHCRESLWEAEAEASRLVWWDR